MEDYTTDGVREYGYFKDIINKNCKELVKYHQRVIKSELLPDDLTIEALYAEQHLSLCAGLFNSSLSVGMELLEYMTKVQYAKLKNEEYPNNKDWKECLVFLEAEYEGHNQKFSLLKSIDEIRDKIRNKQNHGNLLQLVDENYPMAELNLMRVFDSRQPIYTDKKVKFSDNIKDLKKAPEVLDAVHRELVHLTISLVNSFLVEFYILEKD